MGAGTGRSATGKAPAPDEIRKPTIAERRIERMKQLAARIWASSRNFAWPPIRRVLFPPTGTIHCSALNEKGEMSGITTTSGLAFKLPGRCGDSPVIGAGCYTDQDVGSAGATGSGEENIKVAGAHTIVENMRHGMSPQDAGMDALKRIVRNYNGDMNKLRFMDMTYYILRKDGAYAGVSSVGGLFGPAIRTKSRCMMARKRSEKCDAALEGILAGISAISEDSRGVEEGFGVFEVRCSGVAGNCCAGERDKLFECARCRPRLGDFLSARRGS